MSKIEEKIKKEEERLAKLKEQSAAKLKQLKQAKAAKEAREKALQNEKERKLDTRRKILLGALIFEKMKTNEQTRVGVLRELDSFLTKEFDRSLFALPPKSPNNEVQDQKQNDAK